MSDESVQRPAGVENETPDTPRLTISGVPVHSDQCFQHAARVLRFAEGETNPVQFDQYMTLAERWMELGSTMGE